MSGAVRVLSSQFPSVQYLRYSLPSLASKRTKHSRWHLHTTKQQLLDVQIEVEGT